ncbi:NAD(P)/FAD-dependent oxidoreductase [Streptomyces sp. NPDC056817]|uniref:NAD(P)/FAD-dependent oxidoreductase n=1 Tax=Streptomyces sp. NPDC056817 TaxID=3345950 RepID=UPI0036AED63C
MRVVVVGSGIAGAAAGYELARAGVDVVLVDSLTPGRATSAGAGIICPWSSQVDDPDWYRIAVAGAEHYPKLLAALTADGETEFGYRRVGSLRLVSEAGSEAALRRVAERAAKSPMAGEVELIGAGRARELFPPLGHDGPAIHIPGGARLDGRSVREAMLGAAVRRGARVVNGTAAIVADGAVRGVRVDDEFVGADAVIAAAGAWSPQHPRPGAARTPAVAPGLAVATLVETRIGFRPMGPDIRPLLGTVPQVAGLVVVNGLGASGLTIGPFAGSIAARLARQVDPGIDLAPYDPLR